jgi:branched-chain amino acid transport system permease protein
VSVSEASRETGAASNPVQEFFSKRAVPPPAYRGRQWIFLAVVLVVGVFIPVLYGGNSYRDGLLDEIMINAILALGFYWCFSLAGQFTFGVFAVYAAGSYISVWAASHFGGFWSGLLVAGFGCALIGAVTRVAFAKLSPIYFAIATMAVGSLMLILFRQWTSFTGGYNGIGNIAKVTFFGLKLDTTHKRYYLMLGVLVLFLAMTIALLRSPAMRDLTMSRDKGPVAAIAGLKPAQLQLVAFTVGSGMQGVAGSLYAHNSGYFSLESFTIDISLSVLLMVLLGGVGSIYGPVMGAAVIIYLPEALRDEKSYSEIIYAGLVLVIIVAFPGGLADIRRVAMGAVNRARGK